MLVDPAAAPPRALGAGLRRRSRVATRPGGAGARHLGPGACPYPGSGWANHSCALTSDNRAWCWGSNEYGQLGIGDLTPWPRTPVPVATELRFVLIRASYDFTCAVTTSPHTPAE